MRLDEPASRGWLIKTVACGGCAVAGLYLIGLFFGAIFVPLRVFGQSVACQNNVIRLSQAFRIYSDDYDRRLPPSIAWMDRLAPYVPDERRFHCPSVSRQGEARYGYAMNELVAAKPRSGFSNPDATPVVYDSTNLSKSAFDRAASIPIPGRHITRARKDEPSRRGSFVGYAGGNARFRRDAGRNP